jgi:3-hydroxyisobutyrate dehydrogenase-like beta-hydroxyacid dehydrogenase
MAERLGFIGTGAMGGALAAGLIRSGYDLSIYDVDPAVMAPLREQGAEILGSPREVADRAEIVFACLPSNTVSRRVALGPDGALGGRALRIYVENSTLGVPAIEEIAAALAEKGVATLDAPITGGAGGRRGVESGNFATIIAGDLKAFDRVQPILAKLTKKIFYVGDTPGQAQICKVINNAISITGLTIACEALVLGAKNGIDPKRLLEIVNAGSGRNVATEDKLPRMLQPGGSPGKLEIGLKDMKLYLETMHLAGLPALVGSNIMELWQAAAAQGEQDYDGIIAVFERFAGVTVRPPRKQP